MATFNPICGALKIAQEAAGGGAGDACIAVGKVVAKAAIVVVLAAYRLPPSLPTSGELAAIASGNLAVLAVGLLKQLGVPCDDLRLDDGESAAVIKAGGAAGVDVPNVGGSVDACLVTATLVLNEVKGEAKKLVQQTVASNTGWPAHDVPGLEYLPEPNGHLQPTRVHVYAMTKQPVAFKDLFTRPPCVVGTTVTTQSGLPAPFLDGSTALHPLPPAPAATGLLAWFAASVDAVAQASGSSRPQTPGRRASSCRHPAHRTLTSTASTRASS